MSGITVTSTDPRVAAASITVTSEDPDPNRWEPSSEPGLLLYLDSDIGFTPAQWNDQSGNGNHATQGNAARQAVAIPNAYNGRPGIRSDGTKRYALPGALSRTTNTTIGVYCRDEPNGSYRCVVNTNGIPLYANIAGNNWGAQLGSAVDTGKRNDMGRCLMIRTNASGTAANVDFMTDGVNQTLSGAGFASTSGTWLFEDSEPPFGAFSGDCCCVCIWDHRLSDAVAQKFNLWCQGRFGQTLLVAEGNSIIHGYTAPDTTAPTDWIATKPLFIRNSGTGGQTTPGMRTTFNATDKVLIYPPPVGALQRVTIFMGYEMVNYYAGGATAQQCYDQLVGYYGDVRAAAVAAGASKTVKILVCTQMSSQAFGAVGFEAARQFVNTQLKANWQNYGDDIVDPGSDPLIGQPLSWQNATYFIDGVHPTDAGNQVFGAQYLQVGVNRIIARGVT